MMATRLRIAGILLVACAALPSRAEVSGWPSPETAWDLYPAQGHSLCRAVFTTQTGAHGNVLRGCMDPFSFWRIEGNFLQIRDGQGNLTAQFTRAGRNRFQGRGFNKANGQRFRLERAMEARPGPPPSPAQIAGTWTFTRQGGTETCAVELTVGGAANGGNTAKAAFGLACNGLGLFHLRRWDLVGDEVVLIDAFNKEIARLAFAAPNLLRGAGVVMQR